MPSHHTHTVRRQPAPVTELNWLITAYLMLPLPVFAGSVLTQDIDLQCSQPDDMFVQCHYRFVSANDARINQVMVNDYAVKPESGFEYPYPDSVTAILFLVDVSDPGRQAVIEQNRAQISRLAELAKSHQQLGLASFDKELRILVPIGSPPATIARGVTALKAEGMTTELYRNVLKAVQILSAVKADRKAIFLFSDGQAEDQAYFHQDVIKVARESSIIINSFGFPRSTALSVALQSLRRLSEETGGIYRESNSIYALPETILKDAYASIDSGGMIMLELGAVSKNITETNARMAITFRIDDGDSSINVPIRLPVKPVPTVETGTSAPTAGSADTPAVMTSTTRQADRLNPRLWYGVPAALVVLIILTLISILLLHRRHESRGPADPVRQDHARPYAYLISQDEKARRYPITSTIWRIGRSLDNEMTINDGSISRRHAEIQRQGDGKFILHDRKSTNGVYVNSVKVDKIGLIEGDIIEIGDIFLRFTEHPQDYLQEEETAMLRTRAPLPY